MSKLAAAAILVGLWAPTRAYHRPTPSEGKDLFPGGMPVTDGRIQFQSMTDRRFRTLCDIDKVRPLFARDLWGAEAHPRRRSGGLPGRRRAGTADEGGRPLGVYMVEPRDNEFTV